VDSRFDSLRTEWQDRISEANDWTLVQSGRFFVADSILDGYSTELRTLHQHGVNCNSGRVEFLERELEIRERLIEGYYLAMTNHMFPDTLYVLLSNDLSLLTISQRRPSVCQEVAPANADL
jgi:hypothetical protein